MWKSERETGDKNRDREKQIRKLREETESYLWRSQENGWTRKTELIPVSTPCSLSTSRLF